MRRTASEILRDLEIRVARLERNAKRKDPFGLNSYKNVRLFDGLNIDGSPMYHLQDDTTFDLKKTTLSKLLGKVKSFGGIIHGPHLPDGPLYADVGDRDGSVHLLNVGTLKRGDVQTLRMYLYEVFEEDDEFTVYISYGGDFTQK